MRLVSALCIFCFFSIYAVGQKTYSLENKYLSRKITTKDFLHTTEIVNKQTGMRLVPVACDEFILRFSEGTDKVGTDFIMRSEDFKVEKTKEYKLNRKQPGKGLQVTLSNAPNDLVLDVYYELPDNKPYLRKYLSVTSKKERTLERIDVDVLSL